MSTHERRLERRKETSGAMRAFRDVKDGGGADDEIGDGELMGDGGDGGGSGGGGSGGGSGGVEGLKAMKKEQERKRNEREIQREEILRARAAAREERMAKAREKEERTVEMLKEMARRRFGEG